MDWRKTILKISVLVALLGLLFILMHLAGLTTDFSMEKLEQTVNDAGIWGILVYLILFCVCLLLYFPGMLFIFIAVILYGPVWGLVVAYIGACLATGTNFWIVRKFGGQPVGNIKNKRFIKMVSRLDSHPVITVFLIRAVFWLAPYITYFLAFSSIKSGKYHLGNVLGLIPVVLFFGLGFYFFRDVMLDFFG